MIILRRGIFSNDFFLLTKHMRKRTLILICVVVISPFAIKAAVGYLTKKSLVVKLLEAAKSSKELITPEKTVFLNAFKEIPERYFKKPDLINVDLTDYLSDDELNIFTTPDEIIRNEQLQWQEILEVANRDCPEDSANKTISADFVQRNFLDEQATYY